MAARLMARRAARHTSDDSALPRTSQTEVFTNRSHHTKSIEWKEHVARLVPIAVNMGCIHCNQTMHAIFEEPLKMSHYKPA